MSRFDRLEHFVREVERGIWGDDPQMQEAASDALNEPPDAPPCQCDPCEAAHAGGCPFGAWQSKYLFHEPEHVLLANFHSQGLVKEKP